MDLDPMPGWELPVQWDVHRYDGPLTKGIPTIGALKLTYVCDKDDLEERRKQCENQPVLCTGTGFNIYSSRGANVVRECFASSRTRARVIQLDVLISAQAGSWALTLPLPVGCRGRRGPRSTRRRC